MLFVVTVSSVFSVQLLTPLNTAGCTDDYSTGPNTLGVNGTSMGDYGKCDPSKVVDIDNLETWRAYDGPTRFRNYALTLIGIAIGASLIFVPFLPADKAMCAEW